MQANMTRSEALFLRALKVLPGGVSRDTVLRAPHPCYAVRGQGCRVTDVEGREYIDFANNMASLIHGHAFEPVVSAVGNQLRRGSGFTLATEIEVEFAEHMCSRSDAFEQIRFMNSGTEAVMAAVKAARAFTGRPKIAKVEGAYHGAYDYVEVSQTSGPDKWGSADAPEAVALAAGTPGSVLDDVIVIPFNRPETALTILDRFAGSIAGILVDPIPHRVGLIPAEAQFIQSLRNWASSNGALLIFDEVITFRTEVGGTQARYDVKPDLTSLGKAIGGGFPVGAVAGRSEVMSVFASGERGLRLPQSGNFANWFQYYRTRALMAKGAVGQAFARQGTNMRTGFATLHGPSATIDGASSATIKRGVRKFQGADRATFFSTLYGVDANSGTPLRYAADQVGKYFSRSGPASRGGRWY